MLSRDLVSPQERRALERKMSEMEEEMKVRAASLSPLECLPGLSS